ncbi:hypothetical protein Dsin_016189 [Dipteronia sinensis]|uniref:Uncharacterized protein n=1 Tax=Dipteronia sinensis TaxID=43782 RepID=A0AAE0ADL0_9ROSI|nr:hypothetical protein Dsin_016189 [Dipteronia sinensis]
MQNLDHFIPLQDGNDFLSVPLNCEENELLPTKPHLSHTTFSIYTSLLLHTILDRRQAMARNRLRFSDPSCHVNSKYGSAGDSEFDFWGAKNLHHNQFQADAEEFGACSPPSLWKSRNSTEYELSPLLRDGYRNSNLSTRTRSEAIAEGRRELMEMIHNIPECNYELSLKDMVDEVKTSQGMKEEMVIDNRSFGFETEDQMKKQKKTKESGGISRAASMDNEIFLIKMFFPSSLGLKKKPTGKKCSRVSPRTSFDRSADHHHDKEQWIKKMSVEGGNHEECGKNSNKSNTSRKVEVNSNSSPGCWPIFHTKKSKSKSRGCIF